MNISIIGTGYVGLVTGACLADIGHLVTCVDIDRQKIAQLNKGQIPIYEPGLEDLINRNRTNRRISFTCNIRKAILNSKVVFIAVGTPPDEDGSADISFVFQAAQDIAASLNDYKVIVDKSTVPVGTAAKVKEIILQNRKKNISFSVVSNPEFLKEGSAIDDIFNGDRIVIGAEDDQAIDIMKQLYEPLNIPIQITDIFSAELIKYASNAFLATKISFINEIANICEKVGADVTEVAKGMGADRRIGPNFLKAGIGYGGSCFPKDVKAIATTSEQLGYEFKILNSVMEVNQNQKELITEKILSSVSKVENPTVGILGLAFKPNTDDIREAPSLYIIKNLLNNGVNVKVYDPIANENVKKIFPNIQYCNNAYDACMRVDAVVIVTDWDEFSKLDLHELRNCIRVPLIIDGRNVFNPKHVQNAGFSYISVGRAEIKDYSEL